MELLAPRFRVVAADSYGAGRSPAWPIDRTVTLADEVALLEPAFERAGDPHVLVGHSYGGAIALVAALRGPRRVRALALYEPTLFALLDEEQSPPNEADGIRGAVARAVEALADGDPSRAAECFIDFWMGPGSFTRMPEARKPPVVESVRNIAGWANALHRDATRLADLAGLDIPVLYLTGTASPASSRGVGRLLARALPQVTVVEFPGLGHMAPVTHPEQVNQAIERFLSRL
jgi:pimeloyl-ACP methyl ester carboxylesterase